MAAILSDVARLWSLVIGISRAQNIAKQVWKYRVDLTISLLVGLMILTTLTMSGLDIAYVVEVCPTTPSCVNNHWQSKLTLGDMFVITTHLFIIINYLVIFGLLACLYSRLKRDYKDSLTANETSKMNKDLGSLGLLFLSICQLYAVRIYQTIVFHFEIRNLYDTIGYLPDICKTLMIIGICISVYWRIYIATDRDSFKQQLKNRNSILEDELSSDLATINMAD